MEFSELLWSKAIKQLMKNMLSFNALQIVKLFSIVILALVDEHYNFTYIDIVSYRNQSDCGIFPNSFQLKLTN